MKTKMTDTDTLPSTIRARIHEDAIGRVTRFFNATTVDTLNELFQNARRAGATRIAVTLDAINQRITVSDDGEGIADPAALLAFGQTAWNSRKARTEDPAGMGIYALARNEEVTIRSRPRRERSDRRVDRGWSVRLTQAHFLGHEPAAIIRDEDAAFGTTVKFHDTKTASGDVETAARHFPLPVTCNGKLLEQNDFLQDAVHTNSWRGIRIGVYTSRYGRGRLETELNFHGIPVRNVELPQIASIDNMWNVKADTVECSALELVLPARKEVVHTDFIEELRTASTRTIYEAMLNQDEPVDVSAAVHEDARRLGIELPVPRQRLAAWKPDDGESPDFGERRRKLPEDPLVIRSDFERCEQHMLARAFRQAGMADRLCEKLDAYQGYTSYDRLPTITGMTPEVVIGGKTSTLESLRNNQEYREPDRPERITITVETIDADGKAGSLSVDTDVAFAKEDVSMPEAIDPLVTANSEIEPHELAELMYDAHFSPSDDAESDSYETQTEHFHQTRQRTAR